MVDEAINRVVRRYLQALAEQGIPVGYGVVFGSHASSAILEIARREGQVIALAE